MFPIIIPAALITAGALLYSWLGVDSDPEWSNKNTFNNRMRQLQSHIAEANAVFAKCPAFMKNKTQLTAWRNYKKNWSAFYGSVGTLTTFDPNASTIAGAKLYTSQLLQWLDVMKALPDCGAATSPTLAARVAPEPAPTPPPAPGLEYVKYGALAIAAAAVASILRR